MWHCYTSWHLAHLAKMKLIKVDRDINIFLCWASWLPGRSWVAQDVWTESGRVRVGSGRMTTRWWVLNMRLTAMTRSGANIKLCLMAKRSNHIWLMLGVSPHVLLFWAPSVSGRVRRSGGPGMARQCQASPLIIRWSGFTVCTLRTLPIIRHHSDPIRGIMTLGLSHDGFDGYK